MTNIISLEESNRALELTADLTRKKTHAAITDIQRRHGLVASRFIALEKRVEELEARVAELESPEYEPDGDDDGSRDAYE